MKQPTYFVAYVIDDGERVTYHNGQIRPEFGIDNIFDIERIQRAVENDRGIREGSVTVISYQRMGVR